MNHIDTNKVIKGFIAGALIFFILIPIIMIAISYLPNWMIVSELTGSEYFKANVATKPSSKTNCVGLRKEDYGRAY